MGSLEMDITKIVVLGRQNARLHDDWENYRKQLTNRIHNLRRKLGITIKPSPNYSVRKPITADDIRASHEFVRLQLLTSERAWANAMSMREAHSIDEKGITGSLKTHMISRLRKATLYAKNLLAALQEQSISGATIHDILEARAYSASLSGALELEKRNWENCVKNYSEARIIYRALSTATKNDIFKELLTDPVDPSIRYSAYKMQIPRTIAIDTIARDYFPKSDTELVEIIKSLDYDSLEEKSIDSQSEGNTLENNPKTIVWRSRTVNLEDAAISTALGSLNMATRKLSENLASGALTPASERASAYDNVLTASQDAVDATKDAINELTNEGVSQGDHRMQSLLITKTALSYAMISWRIGRNRVLIGSQDGADEKLPSTQLIGHTPPKNLKVASKGRRLSRIREKIVLYDAILQSIESIKELPGIAADTSLCEELDMQREYFSSLKCLALARCHAILMNLKNTLALLARASDKCNMAHSYVFSATESAENSPPNISVSPAEVQNLKILLDREVRRHQALVETFNLDESMSRSEEFSNGVPLIERLNQYPEGGVDLSNIVAYPPRLEPCPIKPLFFDIAWNFIEYPGRKTDVSKSDESVTNVTLEGPEKSSQAKKSWFGFSR